MQQIFPRLQTYISPDIKHSHQIPELNVGICGIQGLECCGWVLYGV